MIARTFVVIERITAEIRTIAVMVIVVMVVNVLIVLLLQSNYTTNVQKRKTKCEKFY